MEMSKRDFVHNLRRSRFGIGLGRGNPLAAMLQETIKLLSAELYQKDIHFISELLQNAEDNSYHPGDTPTIDIVLTKTDVTGTGAPATLLFLNNEVGFSEKNIEALCSAGQSTKKGKNAQGYIGEKGIGFKSVFLVSKRPYIISNGFRIRFNEEPDNEAGLGYIVPEWVEDPGKRLANELEEAYNTIIILPLRREKIKDVAEQLTQISPETLLFLSKISELSIINKLLSPHSRLYLSRTAELRSTKSSEIESSTACLEVSNGQVFQSSNNYYIFKKKFAVPDEAKVDKRKDVDQWTITLAFPIEDRISSTRNTGDVFAFLPSALCSGFPFLINSDFLLVASRETIRFDSPWNKGILSCIPEAFCQAFNQVIKTKALGSKDVPSLAISGIYKYVPVYQCSNHHLNNVRNNILSELTQNNVILCATNIGQATPRSNFCKPAVARRVCPRFREILESALWCPPYLYRCQKFVVDRCLQEKHGHVLQALSVPDMNRTEYFKSLNNEEWIKSLSEDCYVKLLLFLVEEICFYGNLKFLKYLDSTGRLMLASNQELARKDYWHSGSGSGKDGGKCIYWDSEFGSRGSSWLSGWVKQFQNSGWVSLNFVPNACASEIQKKPHLRIWLESAPFNIADLTPSEFAQQLLDVVSDRLDAELAILATKFFFDLHRSGFWTQEIERRISEMPIVNNKEQLQRCNLQRLLPSCVAQWPLLIPGNAWDSSMLKMSDKYLESSTLELSNSEVRTTYLKFLSEQMNATDIPKVKPIDEGLPVHLLINNTEASTLLLKWISESTHTLPERFLSSIQKCEWIKTSRGYCRPTAAFLPSTRMLQFFEVGDVPFIDNKWVPLKVYTPAFQSLGVAVEPATGYGAVLQCLQQLEKGAAADQVEATRVSRLYKYLSLFEACLRKDLSTIFVPASNQGQASWKAKEDCVIHDANGLFEELNLVALDKYYDKRMLAFFEKHVGVPRKASIDKFCELWLSWTEKGGVVKADKCHRVWQELVVARRKSSSSSKAWENLMKSSWIPCIPACGKHSATVKLLPPAKTLIPDELEMEYLFKDSTPCLWVAWYPAAQDIELHELYEMYTAMGVKKLSERVELHMDSYFMNLDFDRKLGTRFVNQGLLRAVLGYLALSKSIPRHNLVLPLVHLREVEIDTPLNAHWSLQMDSYAYTAESQKMVHWNKERQELLYVNEEQRTMSLADFAAQFARAIALGLLSEHKALVPGLEQLLTVLAVSTFNIDAVEKHLMRQNIRLYSEDEKFLKAGVVFSDVKSTESTTEEDDGELDHQDNIRNQTHAELRPTQVLASTTSATDTKRNVETSAGEWTHRTRTSQHSTYAAPMPPPLDNRRQLLQDAQHILSSLTSNSNDWMLELSNKVFNSERITNWRNAHLPTIRYTLDYPLEQGFVKHGMRPCINLDKLLTAAFLDPSIFPGTKGASHQHLSVIGTACLNLCLAMQLVGTDHSRAIHRNLDKLTNDALFAACLRAAGLDECVLVGHSDSVGDSLAAAVMRAVLAVGFCAYDDGLEEVRRIYQHIFLPALDVALN